MKTGNATADDILSRAREAGIQVSPQGDTLSLRYPRAALTEKLRTELLAFKAEIIRLLYREAHPDPDICGECQRKDWVVSLVMDDGSRVCARCLPGAS